ncbi:Bax inhibitor-1/YccA family membrane protein [Acinetobacter gerneri]|uniref:Bax inhibitor-1/YccA family protein n=1 Tax=Acinetobacter gerneri TaxID=202952 RepID=UPI003A89F5FA
MQSNNPILTRVETYSDFNQPMTVQGAVQKSVMLTVISAVVGIAFFIYCAMSLASNPAGALSLANIGALVVGIGGFVLALIATFKPTMARTLAIPYALFEGAFLGGVSLIFQFKYPGAPVQALIATFVTSLVMFGLYRARIIRATEKFKSVVMSATIAICLVFVVQLVMRLAFGSSIPYIFESNWLGIGLAVFIAVIASLNLILDFDLIENAAAQGAPKSFEWLCSIALLATLVWMYISFLRIIGLVRN